jgi:hypothetical protein
MNLPLCFRAQHYQGRSDKMLSMNLEIRNIYAADYSREGSKDTDNFFPLTVEINEKEKPGSEIFHFVAASPLGLSTPFRVGNFVFCADIFRCSNLIGIVKRAAQTLVNHAQSRQDWNEVVEFFNRYSRYDSEDYGPV